MTQISRQQATFRSPTLFWGHARNEVYKFIPSDDGYILRVGVRGTYKKVTKSTIPCQFESEEGCLDYLEKLYLQQKNLYPNIQYPPFEECIRRREVKKNTIGYGTMHAVALFMKPI